MEWNGWNCGMIRAVWVGSTLKYEGVGFNFAFRSILRTPSCQVPSSLPSSETASQAHYQDADPVPSIDPAACRSRVQTCLYSHESYVLETSATVQESCVASRHFAISIVWSPGHVIFASAMQC